MKFSSILLLIALVAALTGCTGGQGAFPSRYPQCERQSQAVYDYLHNGDDHSADHSLDVRLADRRADIFNQPTEVRDGLMRADAERTLTDCEKAIQEGRERLQEPSSNLPVGPGVTSTTISLGVLSDFTGDFASLGKTISGSQQLFWQDQNRAGGVCGRKVDLVVKDHGYNVQNAVGLYQQTKDHVLAYQQLLGSPETAALLNSIAVDGVLTQTVGWSSVVLANPYVIMSGTTYDLEMINAIDWLMKHKGLKQGDKVGHILLAGEYGENALAGSRQAAAANGITLVEEKVLPTEVDMSNSVQAIRASGARYILVTTTPKQLAAIAAATDSLNYDVTLVGNNPTFAPPLLSVPAVRSALERKFFLVTSYAPFSSTAPVPTRVRTEYMAAHPGESYNAGVMYGYGQGEIMYKILDAACISGSLTRPALLKAFQKIASLNTDGLIAPLDYSQVGQPPARAVYMAQPDASTPGGLKTVQDLFSSFEAQAYRRS
jgi:ABC-type branched-subunit amino acid transport system substrate-binding protein